MSHRRAIMHSGMGMDAAEVHDLLTWLECTTRAFTFILSIARGSVEDASI